MTHRNFGTTGTIRKLTNTTKKNGMTYKPGDIVIAKISFSEANSGNVKLRPVLVVSTESHNKSRNDLVVLKISSKSISDTRWEIPIKEVKQTGLIMPSKIVCDGVKTVCKEDVKFIGRLDRLTLKKVKKNLENLLFGI